MKGPCERGATYVHRALGRCMFIGVHPGDGACLIMERYDEHKDKFRYFECEHSDLEPVPVTPLIHTTVSTGASIVRQPDGDYALYCPRITHFMRLGYSDKEVLRALGATDD